MASAAKREAAVALTSAPRASAARTGPICVHLTPFAPTARKLRMDARERWATFYGKTPGQVLRATLNKVRLAPGAARIAMETPGEVSVLGPVPSDLAPLQSGAPDLVPFAIIWEGVTEAEAQAELAALVAHGWRPASVEGGR